METSPVIDEWRAEGQLLATRDMIAEAYLERFSAKMPEEMAKAVNAQADLDVLKKWFRSVISAASADEAKRAVSPN